MVPSAPSSQSSSSNPLEHPEPRTPIIAAAVGVVGAAAVAWFAHGLAKRREAIARFSAAAKDFRAAFSDELAFLESKAETPIGLDAYLFNAYEEKHKIAIATFEHFLSEPDRSRFREACHQYHSGQRADGEPLDMFEMGASYREAMFVEYMGLPFVHPTMRPRELAAHRIRELFKFAPHQ
ncbi:MAG TPA: hypothetical protein VFY73_22555 [Ideonella sp.]|uniref:hypothetical protein n=1 Tax=Ideonella sp. TaxID=1929293 RepID=UPI002E32E6DB|nr:hypothetical protein [Ideonella sp.]HEX5686801.1 hypothetical protein [Ideonella sp.]